VAAFITN